MIVVGCETWMIVEGVTYAAKDAVGVASDNGGGKVVVTIGIVTACKASRAILSAEV